MSFKTINVRHVMLDVNHLIHKIYFKDVTFKKYSKLNA